MQSVWEGRPSVAGPRARRAPPQPPPRIRIAAAWRWRSPATSQPVQRRRVKIAAWLRACGASGPARARAARRLPHSGPISRRIRRNCSYAIVPARPAPLPSASCGASPSPVECPSWGGELPRCAAPSKRARASCSVSTCAFVVRRRVVSTCSAYRVCAIDCDPVLALVHIRHQGRMGK